MVHPRLLQRAGRQLTVDRVFLEVCNELVDVSLVHLLHNDDEVGQLANEKACIP